MSSLGKSDVSVSVEIYPACVIFILWQFKFTIGYDWHLVWYGPLVQWDLRYALRTAKLN